MKKLIIEGKKELTGTIKIGGAKNSIVALIPAAMLTDKKCTIYNVPNISDVHLLIEMMKILGSSWYNELLYGKAKSPLVAGSRNKCREQKNLWGVC